MFWSGTESVVRTLTASRDCFVALLKSPLRSVLDGLMWCGKEGKNGNALNAVDKNHSLLFEQYKNYTVAREHR